jgi:hypothetical protein
MGNRVSYPRPPEQISRSQFINNIKQSLTWTYDKAPARRCPYCHKEDVWHKVAVTGYGMVVRQQDVSHFDCCKAVESIWNKHKKDQKEAMELWVQTIQRLKKLNS